MVYFAMAMALFSDDDYEEVAARLAGTLTSWECWDASWGVPTSGGITQARQRLGHEPLRELFSQVAMPVAGQLTRGAFLGGWRLMAVDGFEWDAPDSRENAEAFGYTGAGTDRGAFPKVRVVTVSECASHAVVDAEIGPAAGRGSGEQAMARRLHARLEEGWLLIADRGFYSFESWTGAAASGAALLWRMKADLVLPVLELLPDGSYSSVLFRPGLHDKARRTLIGAARAGADLDQDKAVTVRVVEYTVPGRAGDGKDELIARPSCRRDCCQLQEPGGHGWRGGEPSLLLGGRGHPVTRQQHGDSLAGVAGEQVSLRLAAPCRAGDLQDAGDLGVGARIEALADRERVPVSGGPGQDRADGGGNRDSHQPCRPA